MSTAVPVTLKNTSRSFFGLLPFGPFGSWIHAARLRSSVARCGHRSSRYYLFLFRADEARSAPTARIAVACYTGSITSRSRIRRWKTESLHLLKRPPRRFCSAFTPSIILRGRRERFATKLTSCLMKCKPRYKSYWSYDYTDDAAAVFKAFPALAMLRLGIIIEDCVKLICDVLHPEWRIEAEGVRGKLRAIQERHELDVDALIKVWAARVRSPTIRRP